MATSDDESWYGDTAKAGRYVGKGFEYLCLSATAAGLLAVFVLLAYVALDAFQPLTADTGWHLVYLSTVVLPGALLGLYYYTRDEPAGEVAYISTGLGLVGVLLSGAFFVLIVELISIFEWFALLVSLGVALGVIYGHRYLRPDAEIERLALLVFAPMYTIFGVLPAELTDLFNFLFSTLGVPVRVPFRVVSLRETILGLPIRPTGWVILLLTLTLPLAALGGRVVQRNRESRRDGLRYVGGILAGAAVGVLAGPLLGIGADGWVIIFTLVAVPLGIYVESVVREQQGAVGLAFPVVLIVGLVLGTVLVGRLGFAGPDAWLDWNFMLNSASYRPEQAGIYPAMVGSVMLLIVVMLMTFPVGVGAAIYLEEYAPDSGWAGRFVTLIEINIGNLAGVPSVVYGLLGLALFVRIADFRAGIIIVGGLTVGLLVLPIVIIAAQEAIRSVPDSRRKASYGMGATRWQTTRNVVLPEAFPGILTGTILALGRAIGETAPLLMIGMAAEVFQPPGGFFDLGTAMPRQIFSWSTEIDPAFRDGVLAAGVITLVAVMLIMNGAAIVIRNKYQREETQ